jgi:hypothetical protein
MSKNLNRTITNIRQGIAILRMRGAKVFVQRGFYFFSSRFFNYQTFYIYRVKLDKTISFQQPPDFIEYKLLNKACDLTDLIKEGYDFGSFVVINDNRLEQGAMCLCFFQNKIITHIIWIALNQMAKESLIDFPCRVDFEFGEAYLGRMARNPKLTRPTFSAIIIYFKALEVSREFGKKSCTFIVRQNNILPQIGLLKRADIRPCSSARYLRLLWWAWWWEKPLEKQSESIITR